MCCGSSDDGNARALDEVTASTKYYFAYGSNMSKEIFIGRRGLNPEFTAPAKISGWQLAMEHPGLPVVEPVYATIKKQKHAEVHGVLYRISDGDFERLRRSEGSAYRQVLVDNIECEGDRIQGYTFVSTRSCAGRKPSRRYLEKLIRGAKENNLPEGYIADLGSIQTIHLPIISRLIDFLGALALKYTASGRSLNLIIVKFGASSNRTGQDPD